MYCLPVYTIRLVRESSLSVDQSVLANPSAVADVLRRYLADRDREYFVVLLVDTKNYLIGINTVSIGGTNYAPVNISNVFKPAILASAFGVILGHNHLSCDPTPSTEDHRITQQLVDAGRLLGIKVLDHVIITDGKYYSFKNGGQL